MSFISVAFLYLYLIAMLVRFSIGRAGNRPLYLAALITLSLVFYGWYEPRYLLILLGLVSIHYVAALGIDRYRADARSTIILTLAIVLSVLVLGYFKYTYFLIDLYYAASSSTQPFLQLDIVLPIAISFYVFQAIAYSVDVYRNRCAVETRFSRLLLFLGFFPQLVAGPIVRGSQFLFQFDRKRPPRWSVFMQGGYLIIRGIFLKVVIADNLGGTVDQNWALLGEESTSGAVACSVVFFFSIQLFCDFAAYTDIARGLAYQLGFRLPLNFKAPLIAATFRDFWQRWHISLSSWFRDYVFIPIGGSKNGFLRTVVSLVIVFCLSGLWHGANTTFLIWGGLNGGFLIVELILLKFAILVDPRRLHSSVRLVIRLSWFVIVQAGWIASLVFFRSSDLAEANNVLAGISTFNTGANEMGIERILFGWVCCLPVLLMHARTFVAERGWISSLYKREQAFYAGIMLALSLMFYAETNPFIYFQF